VNRIGTMGTTMNGTSLGENTAPALDTMVAGHTSDL
jgi:hypothetical protein